MNGTFLVALGAAWPEVRLSMRAKAVAYWGALYATYANWAAVGGHARAFWRLGIRMTKVVPCPIVVSKVNEPPWRSITERRAMARP
jgi:hypothetical protein